MSGTAGLGAAGDGYVVARGDVCYPSALLDLPDPPQRLFVRGDATALSDPCISIIGTRQATPYGTAVAELAARIAVACGLTVVSGGALGCDAAAGREALRLGGRHIVVLGSGADVPYPRRNAYLFDEALASGGAIVSLERWGTQPMRYTFPKRNRVIAALSAATLIAEAAMPSGTFSTAEVATSIGREVLAAPGAIFSPSARGTNYLLASGATLIADEEALEVAISRIYGRLRLQHARTGALPAGTETEHVVLRALTASPLRVEEVAAAAGLGTREVLEVLSALTVRGLVERQYDGRYAASARTLHAQTPFGQNG